MDKQTHLEQLAREYIKNRRTDDKALAVFEELARDPYCDLLWLKSLAMTYVMHMQWDKLKTLAERLENKNQYVTMPVI